MADIVGALPDDAALPALMYPGFSEILFSGPIADKTLVLALEARVKR
jgi:hypothetical protein